MEYLSGGSCLLVVEKKTEKQKNRKTEKQKTRGSEGGSEGREGRSEEVKKGKEGRRRRGRIPNGRGVLLGWKRGMAPRRRQRIRILPHLRRLEPRRIPSKNPRPLAPFL